MTDEITMAAASLRNWLDLSPLRQQTWIAITKWQLAKSGSPDCYNFAQDVDAAIDAELNATIVTTTEKVQRQHDIDEDERDTTG